MKEPPLPENVPKLTTVPIETFESLRFPPDQEVLPNVKSFPDPELKSKIVSAPLLVPARVSTFPVRSKAVFRVVPADILKLEAAPVDAPT